jgi:hypothetical protein
MPGPEGPRCSRRLGRPPRASATVPFRSLRSKSHGSGSGPLPRERSLARPRRPSLGPGPKTLAAGPIPRDPFLRSAPKGSASALIPQGPLIDPVPKDRGSERFQVGSFREADPEGSARWSVPGGPLPIGESRRTRPVGSVFPSWGSFAPSTLSTTGSASPGFASPGTFRPRGLSPPRRFTPLPSCDLEGRCRSWGFFRSAHRARLASSSTRCRKPLRAERNLVRGAPRPRALRNKRSSAPRPWDPPADPPG